MQRREARSAEEQRALRFEVVEPADGVGDRGYRFWESVGADGREGVCAEGAVGDWDCWGVAGVRGRAWLSWDGWGNAGLGVVGGAGAGCGV